MSLLCKIFGHRWVELRIEPDTTHTYEAQGQTAYPAFYIYGCKRRCPAERRVGPWYGLDYRNNMPPVAPFPVTPSGVEEKASES